MIWRLFLDDERFPPAATNDLWFITRTVEDAILLIENYGLPTVMSLDHDLGKGNKTGYDFIKWLVDQDLDNVLDLTQIESFYVHSQNPVGARNMNELFNNYMSFIKE
jgi:hypothetical protein